MPSGMDLNKYLKWRCTCLFSAFTLCRVYSLVMYQVRQLHVLSNSMTEAVLEEQVYEYKKKHPNATDEAVFRDLLKFTVPSSLPGSPAWHSMHLKDIMHAVDVFGMPDFFLTLTSDEVSRSKWDEIRDLEGVLSKINPSFTFNDAPTECASLFHTRLWAFLSKYVIPAKVGGVRPPWYSWVC
jgi:hypothetical protein